MTKNVQGLRITGVSTMSPGDPEAQLHSLLVGVLLNRPFPARKSRRIPAPVPVLRIPHRVGYKSFKAQQLAKGGAAYDFRLAGLVAAYVKVEIVGEGWVGLVWGQGRQKLFENKPVQGVAAVVDFASV